MKKSELPCARVGDDGALVVPAHVAKKLGLRPGAEVAVHVTKGGIWLRPDGFDPDQWWHWTPEWQEGEEEIERERASGINPTVYHTLEEFIESLEEPVRE